MILEQTIDLEKFKAHITDEGARAVIDYAADEAYDFATTVASKQLISSVHGLFNEYDDSELTSTAVVTAVEDIVLALSGPDEQIRFCRHHFASLLLS